jgi:uncharacterized protein involved in response to NO
MPGETCRIRAAVAKMADEPFRLFFPLGTLYCLIGVGYWPLKVFGFAFTAVPSQFHTFLQVYGFMTAFVIGFLGTALPRLTEARRFSAAELAVMFLLHSLVVAFIWRGDDTRAQFAFFATILVFVALLASRFFKRRRNPPETFVFIPLAFLSALSGSALLAGFYVGAPGLPLESYDIGIALAFQSYILLLLVGVGGFLIRSILGWAPPLPASSAERLALSPWRGTAFGGHLLAGLAIVGSFWIEIFIHRESGLALRAVMVTLECIGQIKIHRRSQSGKLTARALKASLWLLVIGTWLPVFSPAEYGIGIMHFVLVGGFALSTFSVATRVILSHCGYGRVLNGAYRPFSIAVGLMLFGVFVRVSADFIPQAYEHHLAYAGVAWIVGLAIWTVAVLSKAVRDTCSKIPSHGHGGTSPIPPSSMRTGSPHNSA